MPDGTAAWSAALDRLESDTTRLESIGPGAAVPESEPWTPPEGLGPLPGELVARARELLVRQRSVVERLAAVLSGNRQQARVADTVHAATGAVGRPAYLDVRA